MRTPTPSEDAIISSGAPGAAHLQGKELASDLGLQGVPVKGPSDVFGLASG